jgi:hypothetical protein
MTTDQEIKDIHHSVWKLADDLAGEGHNPLAIAAIFATTAFTLYRTVLDKDDYEKLMDKMSESRHQVQTLERTFIN